MRIGIPRERVAGERRVSLVPDVVQRLVSEGHEVLVEPGAGVGAFIADSAYVDAGATVAADAAELHRQADMVVRIHRPQEETDDGVNEVALLREGSTLIAMLWPLQFPQLARQLADRGVTAISMDAIPRIARAQALDVLSSMSTVSGYAALLLAARSLPRFLPLLMTAAGTVTPARVFVIGAGVAGLQAIATARRLGAVVSAFDTRPAVKEQVQSLGATFVEADLGHAKAEDARGYATALSEDARRKQLEMMTGQVRDADIVITTALIPGQPAPKLITAGMVKGMKPGSVIVDLAGEFGGNCELSVPGETIAAHGVTIHAPLNLPATIPVHASQMYARNVAALLKLIVRDGKLNLDFEDQVVRDSCITHEGRVVHERTLALLEPAKP